MRYGSRDNGSIRSNYFQAPTPERMIELRNLPFWVKVDGRKGGKEEGRMLCDEVRGN